MSSIELSSTVVVDLARNRLFSSESFVLPYAPSNYDLILAKFCKAKIRRSANAGKPALDRILLQSPSTSAHSQIRM